MDTESYSDANYDGDLTSGWVVPHRQRLLSGPTIDQLREEATANFNGDGDDHFKDASFVNAAKE